MAAFGSLWSRLTGTGPDGRLHGSPTSSNGASSFHLDWMLRGGFVSASVDLEILDAPAVPRLYFWAMQVDVADAAGRAAGGAHLGLQWHPSHPGSTAVNWGGYHASGAELSGSVSPLRSATANPNTRDLRWVPGRVYRLAVALVSDAAATAGAADDAPTGTRAWRGTVTDLSVGDQVIVRDLWIPGEHITRVTMWSEVFARCDDPPVAVRWSNARAVDADGTPRHPDGYRVNYQTGRDGGCANTDSSAYLDDGGIVQRTATDRRTAQGATLRVT